MSGFNMESPQVKFDRITACRGCADLTYTFRGTGSWGVRCGRGFDYDICDMADDRGLWRSPLSGGSGRILLLPEFLDGLADRGGDDEETPGEGERCDTYDAGARAEEAPAGEEGVYTGPLPLAGRVVEIAAGAALAIIAILMIVGR